MYMCMEFHSKSQMENDTKSTWCYYKCTVHNKMLLALVYKWKTKSLVKEILFHFKHID